MHTRGLQVPQVPHVQFTRRRVLAAIPQAAITRAAMAHPAFAQAALAAALPMLAAGRVQAQAQAQAKQPSATATPPLDLDTLMALLAQRKSGEARFTEERTVTGFDSPLRASGTLSFTAPDRFARQTLEPTRERMEVAGHQIRLERGGRARTLTLDSVPELTALVEGLRGTLGGNAALLRRHFQVRVSGHAGLWTLTLAPLEATLATQVRRLQIVGTGADLRSVELTLANNDRSLMLIEPLAGPGATPGTGMGTSAGTGTAASPGSPARPASAAR